MATKGTMLIKTRKDWELPERAATAEEDYRRRRRFLRQVGLGLAGAVLLPGPLAAATAGFPSKRNIRYSLPGLDLTEYEHITSYNNFYEFSTGKGEVRELANDGWKTEPWTIEVKGHVNRPLKLEVNDLIRKAGGIEQRVYRFRCVEAWAMVVPWDGFPMNKLIEMVEPTEKAKYVKFTTFIDRKAAPGQRGGGINWPYVEGLTMEEAANELTLLATGLYGKPMPNQNGAPIRLIVPWKYGFKSIKSIVKIEFTSRQPLNTWQALQPQEYGFYANVNPHVAHPRWSQASERVIGAGFFGGRQPTLMFNGYEKQVADLYQGLDLRANF